MQVIIEIAQALASLFRPPDPLRYAIPDQARPWAPQETKQRQPQQRAQPLQEGVRVVPGTATLVKDRETVVNGNKVVETVVVSTAKGREKSITAQDRAAITAAGLSLEKAVRAKPLFAQGISAREASRALNASFGRGYSERSMDQYWAAFAKAEMPPTQAIGESKQESPYQVEW